MEGRILPCSLGMAERNSARTVCLSDVVCISLTVNETDDHAGH